MKRQWNRGINVIEFIPDKKQKKTTPFGNDLSKLYVALYADLPVKGIRLKIK